MLVVGGPCVGSVFCVGRVFLRVSVPLRGMTSGSERRGLASAKILHDCNVLPVNVINRLIFLAREKNKNKQVIQTISVYPRESFEINRQSLSAVNGVLISFLLVSLLLFTNL